MYVMSTVKQMPDIIDSIERYKTIVVDNGIIKDYFTAFKSVSSVGTGLM